MHHYQSKTFIKKMEVSYFFPLQWPFILYSWFTPQGMWCLWRKRNWRTFEDLDSSDDQLLAFSGSLFDWSRAW